MGFPITAEIMQGGNQQAFPLYVWFIDHPNGPVWKEMDESFNYWNNKTGPHLAFFVDPFQREEWAREFLGHFFEPDLVADLLSARQHVQHYFRNRLANRACWQFWIPENRLPVAIIAARWDARKAIVCNLPSREAVRELLEHLTQFGRQKLPLGLPETSNIQFLIDGELKRILSAQEICDRLRLNRCALEISNNHIGQIGIDAFNSDAIGPLLRSLQERNGLPMADNNPNLSDIATHTFLASLIDLIALANSIIGKIGKTLLRCNKCDGSNESTKNLPIFSSLMCNYRKLQNSLTSLEQDPTLTENERIDLILKLMQEATFQFDELKVDFRLEALIGKETYQRLLSDSRAALRSSEAIYALSELIPEINEDLSVVLFGFWKATEIEGRRIVLEILSRNGEIPVWDSKEKKIELVQDAETVKNDYTSGSLGRLFRNARFDSNSPWHELPLKKLGKKLYKMNSVSRNPYTHRDTLKDTTKALSSRQLVAKPPEGILPLAMRCIEIIQDQRPHSKCSSISSQEGNHN